jgi:nucleotide-binding universal stress UspA family protein
MKTIVVGFDGSPAAQRALDQAMALAPRLDARVELTYAVALPGPLIGDFSGMATQDAHERMKAEAQRSLDAQLRRLSPGTTPIGTAVLEGRPADALAERASAPEVALLVVGRSGHGAIAHALLGSVVNRLLTLSSQPVLVVP